MNRAYRATLVFFALSGFVFAFGSRAETPGEIPKPWTYEGSMKLQEQQRQQDQQGQQGQQQQQSPQGTGGRMAPG
ncbi:MAG: hypothetical protein ABI900_10930, partial [Betaproteobacteria bacterium]